MEPRISTRTAALESSAMIEVRMIDGVVIGEDSAVGYVAVAAETDIVVMPIISPVVPAPSKTAKEADSKAQAKRNSRSGKVQPRIPIPTWPHPDRLSIHQPGIV